MVVEVAAIVAVVVVVVVVGKFTRNLQDRTGYSRKLIFDRTISNRYLSSFFFAFRCFPMFDRRRWRVIERASARFFFLVGEFLLHYGTRRIDFILFYLFDLVDFVFWCCARTTWFGREDIVLR